jgi:excisionase family DNA binding protein
MENPFELILERLNTIENLIKSLNKIDLVPSSPVNEILNLNEAAEYPGLAKSTLYKMASCRLIPHSKIGKKIFLRRNELRDWISG